MAKRHSDRKLRAEIRARMAATCESYQRARHRIQAIGGPHASTSVWMTHDVDLVELARFGVAMTLATIRGSGVHYFALLPRAPRLAGAQSFALPSMRFLEPRGTN